MLPLDPNKNAFPDPRHYHPQDGLLAYGGDLSEERVWWAYQNGIFPWFNEGDEILWWCPDPRFVLYPKDLKASKSMKKILRDEVFSFSENRCFEEVMRNCGKITRKDQDSTWISEEMITAYVQLHEKGWAKSIEVWHQDELAGGFYGVDLGHVFCGESMFSKVSNASKAGFIQFVQNYANQYKIIDCQIHSEHLESLGAKNISKIEFLDILQKKQRTP